MARSSLYQVIQIAPEATKGTTPDSGADIQLLSTRIEPGIQLEAQAYRAMGSKFPAVVAPNKEWVEAGISGPANYNELTYLLASLIATPTPVQQGATAAYQSTFTIDNDGADSITSLYVQQGGLAIGDRAHEFNYGLVTELGIDFSRDSVEISGSMIGQRLADDIEMGICEIQTLTITGTPTGGTFTITYDGQTTEAIDYDATAAEVQSALEALSNITAGDVVCSGGALPGTGVAILFEGNLARTDVALMTTTDSLTGGTDPESAIVETRKGGACSTLAQKVILPTHLSIYMDTAGAGLGTTELTKVVSASWNLGSRFNPAWFIDASETSWAEYVEAEPDMTLELVLEADATAMALLTQMRAGTKRFIRIEAIGDLADTGYYYTMYLDMCGIIENPGDFGDEDGVFTIPFTFRGAYDATWGKALNITLINTVSAL